MRMTLRDIQGSEYTKNTAFDECALRSAGVRVALRDSFQGPKEMAPIIRCWKRACSVSRRYMADGLVDIIAFGEMSSRYLRSGCVGLMRSDVCISTYHVTEGECMNYVTVFLRMLQIKNDKFSLKKFFSYSFQSSFA